MWRLGRVFLAEVKTVMKALSGTVLDMFKEQRGQFL